MREFEVAGHEPSLLPEGREWTLAWADEFDGTAIDGEKWSPRLHIMGTRYDTWVEDAVELDGESHLVFKLVERDGDYFTTQLQTGENFMDKPGKHFNRFTWPIGKLSVPKFQHKFGYYECRCRLQKKDGWWSAFWLQSPIQGSTLDPAFSGVEMDIMESFAPGIVSHNLHWNGCGEDWEHAGSGNHPVGGGPDDFHRFGLLWSKDGYDFYVDGERVWHQDGPVSEREEFILISTECMGYRDAEHNPSEKLKDAIPDDFVVDYIRVFDEV